MVKWLCYTLLIIVSVFQKVGGNSLQPVERNSLFATGKWIKIETSSTGIHKISFSWLKSIGFAHPDRVKLFGSRNEPMSRSNANPSENLPVQIPTLRFNEGGGNESLIFFVQGPINWNYDPPSGVFTPVLNQSARGKSWYFLTEDWGTDLAFPSSEQPSANQGIRTVSYDDFTMCGDENINLLESGSRWFSSLLSGGAVYRKKITFQDRDENEAIKLNVSAAARSASQTGMEVTINGNTLGTMNFAPVHPNSDADFASADSFRIASIVSGADIDLTLKYIGASSDQCWFDQAAIQLRRNLQYRGVPLVFRDSRSIGKEKIAEFQIGGAKTGLLLWDITNPLLPKQVAYQLSNGQILFRARSDSLRNYVLFDPYGQFPGLNQKEGVTNTDLLRMPAPQYLILTTTGFLDQANRLAAFHRQTDGMSVAVVTVESIFNEIAGGYPDISALRDLIRMLYQKAVGPDGPTLKYLLLFGKGTCDPVHEPGENNPNWIPTFQSENSLNSINSFVTDDFYGFMGLGEGDQQGKVALGIGRIPAVSVNEATIAVDKIVHYHETRTLGSWRNNITFIGDDEDNNIHVNDSEKLAALVNQKNPEFRTLKIYLDAYKQVLTPEERYPDVTDAIRRSVHEGDLIVDYIGHASEDGLAHERILTSKDIDGWTNKDRLPLFVTATCEFSRWDMTMKRSAGERLFFHPAGGAIALLSTTRLVYSASNFDINKSFINHVFDKDRLGAGLRLGDMVRIVKNENSGSVNTLKFCLLGDPALRLNYPEYRCINLEINHQAVDQFSGSFSPLTQVTISGEIQDFRGQKINQFNGTLSAMVYDQPAEKKTLGNGGLTPFSYQVQDNLLFNGAVPVKEGLFTYSFVVPKDVSFNKNAGLIRYYSSNGLTDANGSFAGIHFNGTGILAVADNKGPAVTLFLENEKFREGGTVSPNPLLLVYLNDESGINTSDAGIGHDIVLELDDRSAGPVILNDFYRSDPAEWKSGTIVYPLSTLTTGQHTLKLRVWDNAGNSSVISIQFVVKDELVISNVYNFPNAFSDKTRFVISQNRYDELFEVHLEIMDLAGRKVYSDSQMVVSQGYEISDLFWTPALANPAPANGVYLYRITIADRDGHRSSGSGRLIYKK